MSVEQNKANLKRIYDEIYNKGDLSKVPELISPDYLHGDLKGQEGWKQIVNTFHSAFPDVHITIDQIVGEGDTLAYRISCEGTHQGALINAKPTGKKIKWTQALFSDFKDGKLVSAVALADMLGMLQQMGYLPPTEEIGK